MLLAVALAFVFFCAHSNSRVQSGDQIPEEVVSNTIHLIIETPDLQAYAVQKLFTVLSKEILKVASLVPSLLPSFLVVLTITRAWWVLSTATARTNWRVVPR